MIEPTHVRPFDPAAPAGANHVAVSAGDSAAQVLRYHAPASAGTIGPTYDRRRVVAGAAFYLLAGLTTAAGLAWALLAYFGRVGPMNPASLLVAFVVAWVFLWAGAWNLTQFARDARPTRVQWLLALFTRVAATCHLSIPVVSLSGWIGNRLSVNLGRLYLVLCLVVAFAVPLQAMMIFHAARRNGWAVAAVVLALTSAVLLPQLGGNRFPAMDPLALLVRLPMSPYPSVDDQANFVRPTIGAPRPYRIVIPLVDGLTLLVMSGLWATHRRGIDGADDSDLNS